MSEIRPDITKVSSFNGVNPQNNALNIDVENLVKNLTDLSSYHAGDSVSARIKNLIYKHEKFLMLGLISQTLNFQLQKEIKIRADKLNAPGGEQIKKELKILELAKIYTEKYSAQILIEKLGEKIPEKDLYLIGKILKNPRLEYLLFNPGIIIDEIRGDIYEKSPQTTMEKCPEESYFESLIDKAPSNAKKEEIKKKLSKARFNYTERPVLSGLSRLQLLKIYLIKKTLKDKNILEKIADMAARDLQDKDHEYGGKFYIDDNSKVQLQEVKSKIKDDESYSPDPEELFSNCFATTHLHMQAEGLCSPSGYLRASSGDITYTDKNDISDLLISVMYRSENKNILGFYFNLDFYFTDKRNPQEHKAVIIDLGRIELPVNIN